MTHADLCKRAGAWLAGRHRCCVVAVESRTWKTSEQPDAIGWTSWGWSVVVEVKVSRADFRRDKNKWHIRAGQSMGQERWYLTPPGLLRADEIPDGYGLAEAHERAIRVVKPACTTPTGQRVLLHDRLRWEVCLLLSLVQRERRVRGADMTVGDECQPGLDDEPEYSI